MYNLTPNQKKIFIVIAIIAVAVVGYYVYGRSDNYTEITEEEDEILISNESTEETKESKDDTIIVHVYGAVANPGIVELKANSRISDAINSAGGLTEDADISKINLAYVLEDGMRVTIPTKEEAQSENITEEELVSTDSGGTVYTSSAESSESGKTSIVNINKATQTELETLPGIGPSIALKIITYREENGKFSSIEDIKNVSGIGDAKYANIKDYICVK